MNVSNCRFEGYNYTVQYAEGTEGTFTHSIVLDSGHQGVTLYEGAKAAITDNIIAGSKYHGLRSTGGELDVRNNLIINNNNRGIYLGNKSATGVISNNLLINNTEGISGFAASKVTVKNNIFSGSTFAGIDMRDSCWLAIENNIFVNNLCGIKLIPEGGKDNNTIGNNIFRDNKKATEDIDVKTDQTDIDPQFNDPANGDYTSQNETVMEQKQGLTNPQVLKTLWEIWQKNKTPEN